MNYPYAETGERILQLRKSKKLTREKLAEKANISVQFLADIEKERKNMTVTTLRNLASALMVTTDYIVNGDETIAVSDSEIISLYHQLSPEMQNYSLKIMRLFAGTEEI